MNNITISKLWNIIAKYEEVKGKKPRIIFLTSKQHKKLDKEAKAKSGWKDVPPSKEKAILENCFGVLLISELDQDDMLDLRSVKE